MATDTKAMVEDALTRAGGNRTHAAVLLGWTTEKLKNTIHNSPYLKERWADSDSSNRVPSEFDVLHRPPLLPATPTPVEVPGSERFNPDFMTPAHAMSVAVALKKEDAILKDGLKALGLQSEEMNEALALQAFYSQNFRQSIEIIGGGVTKTVLKLMTQMRRIETRLDTVRGALESLGELQDEIREGWVNEEKNLMDSYLTIADQLRKTNEMANKGALIMAMIRQKNIGKGGPKTAKPGFSPSNQTLPEPK